MSTKHLVAILVLLALAVPATPAHAGGVVSVCDEAHLRAALAGGGTVIFSCSGTITLTAEITIAADTTIDGTGQAVIISGNNAVRVLTVNSGVRLNVDGLTVANGYASGSDSGSDGGSDGGSGIDNHGIVTIVNSVFTENRADFRDYYGSGGGIYNDGTLTIGNSTFSGNSAIGAGGGIFNYGTLTVSNSTFSGNGASAAGSVGGGIFNREGGSVEVSNSTFSDNSGAGGGGGIGNYGTLTVSNSTFSGNSVRGAGGGIGNYGTLTVSNSTFSGNRASNRGGGIDNYLFGTLTVSNSTFSGNTARVGGGIYTRGTVTVSNSTFSGNGASDSGGGIYSGGIVTQKNTIVANSLRGNNCAGGITDGGGNLSYPDTTCPGINVDPMLGPLQNNIGPTETMQLGPGSAAIDAGIDTICAATPVNNRDQRGIARPWGTHCDIGAVEQVPIKKLWFPAARGQ